MTIALPHKPQFTLVSFYTAQYAQHAQRLAQSCEAHGFANHSIELMGSRGTWLKNCAAKAQFCLEANKRFKSPILWVDADATVEGSLDYFNALVDSNIDFAAYIPEGLHQSKRRPGINSRLCSGTLFFNDTVGARHLLRAWSQMSETDSPTYDQEILYAALSESHKLALDTHLDFTFVNLPERFCHIASFMPNVRPIIAHHQASRELRDLIQ